jgi:hypothetical protein
LERQRNCRGLELANKEQTSSISAGIDSARAEPVSEVEELKRIIPVIEEWPGKSRSRSRRYPKPAVAEAACRETPAS